MTWFGRMLRANRSAVTEPTTYLTIYRFRLFCFLAGNSFEACLFDKVYLLHGTARSHLFRQ